MNNLGSKPLLPLGFVCPVSEPTSAVGNTGGEKKDGEIHTVHNSISICSHEKPLSKRDTGEYALIFSVIRFEEVIIILEKMPWI